MRHRLALLVTGLACSAALVVGCTAADPSENETSDEEPLGAEESPSGSPSRLHTDDAFSGDAVIVANVNQVDACDAPDVDVFVSLLTLDDKVFADARPDEVIVRLDGEEVDDFELRKVSEADLPLNSVLVLDRSGSMQGERMQNLKFAAQSYLERKADDDRTAVVAFDEDVEVVEEFSTEKQSLQQAIEDIQPSGDTSIYDGLEEAVQLSPECGRKAILLMSDGEDTTSKTDIDAVVNKARNRNIPVFVVGLDMDPRVGERLANETGAQFFEVSTPREFQSVYERIDAQLAGQYVLGLGLDGVDAAGEERTIEVIFGNGQYRTYGSGTVVH